MRNVGFQDDIDVHARLEFIVRIEKFQPQLGRTCFGFEVGVNKKDLTLESFPRNVGQLHFGWHALFNPGKLILVNIDTHPDGRKINDHDLILNFTLFDKMALKSGLLGDGSGRR